jgi:hypothetical protein
MKRKNRSPRRSSSPAGGEGSYTCPHCGETIVVPLDRSAGAEQEYGEDCPVCCSPNVLHVEFLGHGEPPRVWAEAE